jgi:hypothetical protein
MVLANSIVTKVQLGLSLKADYFDPAGLDVSDMKVVHQAYMIAAEAFIDPKVKEAPYGNHRTEKTRFSAFWNKDGRE